VTSLYNAHGTHHLHSFMLFVCILQSTVLQYEELKVSHEDNGTGGCGGSGSSGSSTRSSGSDARKSYQRILTRGHITGDGFFTLGKI